MAILMVGVSRQDSATVDETTFLGSGYSFWQGYRYYLIADHPPLGQMLASLPLLGMHIRLSDNAKALLEKKVGYPWTLSWRCELQPVQSLFPHGRNDWYFWAMPEGQLFGQIFVYEGSNNGDAMLFRARLVQVVLTLLAGVFIFWWAQRLAGPEAAVLALIMWVANPLALGYGHLVITDVGAMLMTPVAVFAFGRFLEQPNRRTVIWAGIATACALALKYTALTLGPIFVTLIILYYFRQKPNWRHWRDVFKNCLWGILAGWIVLLIAYFPEWKTPPPIDPGQADLLGVPEWFSTLRPLLLPRDFFKGLSIGLAQAHHMREGYLLGKWKVGGWWYYFPFAMALKTPIPLLLLLGAALVLLGKQIRSLSFSMLIPWIAALVYLLMGMTSKVNIGVRHTLPIYPLLAVGIAALWPSISYRARITASVLVGWLIFEALFTYPLYLQYFNEFAGGSRNGYRYLVDSNYDWGQDAKRLKTFLAERGIQHIYLDYFGTQYSIEDLKIPNTRVTAEQAHQINEGWLVVSASQLMRPEWSWLREYQPFARVAYTLFIYQFNHNK